jgi:hypothetical protein
MAKAIINSREIFGNVHLGEGGGASFDKVLEAGQISTTSSYATATFEDISDYEYVLVKIYDTVSGTDYADYRYIKVSDIGSGIEIAPTMYLQTSIWVRLTTTSVEAVRYGGSYYNIYCDIVGFENDIFA